MTVSDELRRMLDELGVEHRDNDETISDGDGSDTYGQRHFTRWFHHGMECTFAHATHDGVWEATVFDGGLATGFTPAQAIAATVGARKTTTRNGRYKTKYGRRVPLCECCGYSIGDDRYNFCPKCGAEIVGDEK